MDTLTNYFNWNELTVHCSPSERNHALDAPRFSNFFKLLQLVNYVRALIGRPMYVTSCYRDSEHNRKVGGSLRSQHMEFGAMDFSCNDVPYVFNLLKSYTTDERFMLEVGQCILYRKKNFIHISIPTSTHHNEFFEK